MSIKPIWSYDITIWKSIKPSNIKTIQTYQFICLRIFIKEPWFVINMTIHHDLEIKSVIETASIFYKRFHFKTLSHKNLLIDHPTRIENSTRQTCETSQTKLILRPTPVTQTLNHPGFAAVHLLDQALISLKYLYYKKF